MAPGAGTDEEDPQQQENYRAGKGMEVVAQEASHAVASLRTMYPMPRIDSMKRNPIFRLMFETWV